MPDTLNYVQMLQEAIRKAYGCDSTHSVTVPVWEMFQGKTAWEGNVEVFELTGHASAKLAYAWGHAMCATGSEVRVVTVLGVPPVDSPRKAVQVSIVADAKKKA